ncbi:hypothetical protein THAOC_05657, partial [Thalassiosira oceanica]
PDTALLDLVEAAKPFWDKDRTLPMKPLSKHLRKCYDANLFSTEIRLVMLPLVCNAKKLAYDEAENDDTTKMICSLISRYQSKYFQFSVRSRKTTVDNMPSRNEAQKLTDKVMGMLKEEAGVFV